MKSIRLVIHSKAKILSFVGLYVICVSLVIWRLYCIIYLDGLFIFGDVTYHYYPAGLAILNGGNPYDSHFINHPPYMLLLFALLVWIFDNPLTIGIFILASFLAVPVLSYHAATSYLSQEKSLLISWLVTLNPATLHAGVFLLDDDLIVMNMLLVFLIVQNRRPMLGIVLGGLFGGFKYVPYIIAAVVSLIEKRWSFSRKLLGVFVSSLMFLSSILVGYLLWDTNVLERYLNYTNTVGISWPSMSIFYVLNFYFDLGTNDDIRILALGISSGMLLLIFIIMMRFYSNPNRMNLIAFSAVIIFTYLSNSTNNYTYYVWITPFLLLFLLDSDGSSVRSKVIYLIGGVAILLMGYFVAEWANFTWAYGPDMVVYAHYGSVYVFFLLMLFYLGLIARLVRSSRSSFTQPDNSTPLQ